MGPRIQRGRNSDHTGSVVQKTERIDRQTAAGSLVDEPNQGETFLSSFYQITKRMLHFRLIHIHMSISWEIILKFFS